MALDVSLLPCCPACRHELPPRIAALGGCCCFHTPPPPFTEAAERKAEELEAARRASA